MAFQCGFFNSENGDRKYSAEQMNNPYKRIVSNGVFAKSGGESSTDYQVQANGNMTVTVKEGRGIFADKWAFLDADMVMNVPMAHVSYTRIDSVIVRIDSSASVRAGSIIYRSGEPGEEPEPPELENTVEVKEYRLANITVAPNVTAITQASVEDTRPTSECGFIHNLLWDSDITATYAQWQAQFEEWFLNLKQILATATIISSFTSHYVATEDDETDIPIGIQRFNPALDILQVYINGLFLTPEVDYTLGDNDDIILTLGVDEGTEISFVVYKSVDGSEAESVVRYVDELLAVSPVASNGAVEVSVPATGDVLQSFVNAGVGLHTMYSAYGAANAPKQGAFRYFGHMTAAGYGWIIGFMANGSVFTNYLDNGVWQGWRSVYDKVPDALYYSATGTFPNEDVEITPSKPLSECRNGWVLEFSGYDDTNRVARDVYAQTVHIPKKSYKNANWNGEGFSMPLAYIYDNATDTASFCFKNFTLYNDRLVSGSLNAIGKQRNMVLRAIYEY
jgi:hypothetical protein